MIVINISLIHIIDGIFLNWSKTDFNWMLKNGNCRMHFRPCLFGWNFVFIEKQLRSQFLILIGCYKITN